jgi:hypothetical protein
MNRKLLWLLPAALGAGAWLHAQTYSLERARVAAGGGASAGGSYALRGTLGPEAGAPLSGGGYTLTGGLQPGVGVVQTPGAPALGVTRHADGTVTVSWPRPATGWELQQGTLLSPAGWTASPHPVTDGATNRSITIQPPAGWLFFRLHKGS